MNLESEEIVQETCRTGETYTHKYKLDYWENAKWREEGAKGRKGPLYGPVFSIIGTDDRDMAYGRPISQSLPFRSPLIPNNP